MKTQDLLDDLVYELNREIEFNWLHKWREPGHQTQFMPSLSTRISNHWNFSLNYWIPRHPNYNTSYCWVITSMYATQNQPTIGGPMRLWRDAGYIELPVETPLEHVLIKIDEMIQNILAGKVE